VFVSLKENIISSPIIITPDWSLHFEIICDACGVELCVILWKNKNNFDHPIYYASNTLIWDQNKYTVMEQELLVVLMAKKEAKPRLICWVLLFHDFSFEVKDRKDCENQVADHL
ncbi:hypothetical protein MTR67_034438, partial [Solanum verrucosum]